jgi:DNA-binding transcriptional regulator YiaG
MDDAQFRDILDRLSLTATETAELLGVTRQAVWLWETGRRTVPDYIARLLTLVEAHGVAEARRTLEKRK